MSESTCLLCEEGSGGEASLDSEKGDPMGRWRKRLHRAGRRLRAASAAAALLLVAALYLLSRPHPRLPLMPNLEQPTDQIPPPESNSQMIDHPEHLVWSSKCRIPAINPLSAEAMAMFKGKRYISCSTGLPFVYMAENMTGQSVLYINQTALSKSKIKSNAISCCYMNVTRSDIDTKIVKSSCKAFHDSAVLLDTEEFVITKCKIHDGKVKYKEKVQENLFMNVRPSDEVKKRFIKFENTSSNVAWNVLIIGIDTLSRMNLQRAMPKTHRFLKKNYWLDFQGYNKMDDNTFPNLMAILTGRNQSRARKMCDSVGAHSPDHCDFMWKIYQNVGYVTAYAEDYVAIETFRKPSHKGFVHKPTDHYLHPLFAIAEKRVNKHSEHVYCAGEMTSAEVLMQYAYNFITRYKNNPYFGFFWANTFSHDDITSPHSMDEKVAEFLELLRVSDTLQTTLVLFLSDHGARFGDMRAFLPSGYYEERLPSFFAWIPPRFKMLHPEAYQSLLLNTKRLTNPYDLHLTLLDILMISGRINALKPSEGCPKCQSLFRPVPVERSCQDSSIAPHWCTCDPHKPLPLNHTIANRAVHYIVDDVIEDVLSVVNTKECRKCAKLHIEKIVSLHEYEYLEPRNNSTDFLVVFSTNHGMTFEATIRYFEANETFSVQGIVSRLTVYRGQGGCAPTDHLKKYCFCLNKC